MSAVGDQPKEILGNLLFQRSADISPRLNDPNFERHVIEQKQERGSSQQQSEKKDALRIRSRYYGKLEQFSCRKIHDIDRKIKNLNQQIENCRFRLQLQLHPMMRAEMNSFLRQAIRELQEEQAKNLKPLKFKFPRSRY